MSYRQEIVGEYFLLALPVDVTDSNGEKFNFLIDSIIALVYTIRDIRNVAVIATVCDGENLEGT